MRLILTIHNYLIAILVYIGCINFVYVDKKASSHSCIHYFSSIREYYNAVISNPHAISIYLKKLRRSFFRFTGYKSNKNQNVFHVLKLIILLLICSSANATTYYVSNAGNNSNVGSQASPFATLTKAMSVVVSKDSVLLNKGNSWNEKIFISVDSLYFGAYGTGLKPIITGLQTVTVTSAGGNIWTATVSNTPSYLNTVLVDGVIRAKGRYPNSSYLSFSSSTATQLNNTGLTGTPDYTGGEVVVRPVHWILNKSIVSSQSGATLNLASSLRYTPLDGYGFFIQNLPSLLDVAGEWAFNSTSKLFSVYSTATPTVQIATIDTLIYANHKSNITINGLSFIGANSAAILLDTTDNVTIKNSSFNYSGTFGILGIDATHTTILNDSIQNSLTGGLYFAGSAYSIIDGNYVKNSGIIPGMSLSGAAKRVGVYMGWGDSAIENRNSKIRNNRVDSTGYTGIMFFSDSGKIYRNEISNFCLNTDDGGGIYAGYQNDTILSNIIHDGYGATAGATGQVISPGIYFDDTQNGNYADSNTVFNTVWACIFFHNNNHNTARGNTLISTVGNPFLTQTSSSNLTFNGNILYSKSSAYYTIDHYFRNNDAFDNNYYIRPTNESNKLKVSGVTYSTFAAWKAATGYDTNGGETPTGITTDLPLFYYNPTPADSTITLPYDCIDAKGVSKSGVVSLKPFTSTLLFKALPNPYLKRKIQGVSIFNIQKR